MNTFAANKFDELRNYLYSLTNECSLNDFSKQDLIDTIFSLEEIVSEINSNLD
jgi:hypothetical protein